MKLTSRLLLPLGLAAVMFGAARASAADPAGSEHPLIVHEWGTFTSFSGSDGIQLDYRPLTVSDLPEFVYSDFTLSGLSKRRVFARQRMETPVTYFYSDVERDVRVSVAFPRGRLTEFYPPPLTQRLAAANDGLPQAIEQVDWGNVHIIPQSSLTTHVADAKVADRLNRHIAAGLVPWMDDDNPYYRARETDSALLFVRREADQNAPFSQAAFDFHGDHFEKFLFYRGTGNFTLPVTVQALGNDRVRITNLSPGDLHGAIVVHNDGQQLRMKFAGDIPGNGGVEAALPAAAEITGDPAQDLDAKLVEVLTAEGLYEKEAKAMVNTWRHSWYNEPGMRVLFLVPQVITDTVLPLTVEPKPEQTIRVLVARMEFLTPEDEQHLLTLIRKSACEGAEQRTALMEDLQRRGRLAEPAIQHVAKSTDDPMVQSEAERVRRVLLGQEAG